MSKRRRRASLVRASAHRAVPHCSRSMWPVMGRGLAGATGRRRMPCWRPSAVISAGMSQIGTSTASVTESLASMKAPQGLVALIVVVSPDGMIGASVRVCEILLLDCCDARDEEIGRVFEARALPAKRSCGQVFDTPSSQGTWRGWWQGARVRGSAPTAPASARISVFVDLAVIRASRCGWPPDRRQAVRISASRDAVVGRRGGRCWWPNAHGARTTAAQRSLPELEAAGDEGIADAVGKRRSKVYGVP